MVDAGSSARSPSTVTRVLPSGAVKEERNGKVKHERRSISGKDIEPKNTCCSLNKGGCCALRSHWYHECPVAIQHSYCQSSDINQASINRHTADIGERAGRGCELLTNIIEGPQREVEQKRRLRAAM